MEHIDEQRPDLHRDDDESFDEVERAHLRALQRQVADEAAGRFAPSPLQTRLDALVRRVDDLARAGAPWIAAERLGELEQRFAEVELEQGRAAALMHRIDGAERRLANLEQRFADVEQRGRHICRVAADALEVSERRIVELERRLEQAEGRAP